MTKKRGLTIAQLITQLEAIEDKSLRIKCDNTGQPLIAFEIDKAETFTKYPSRAKPIVWLKFAHLYC